MARNPASPTAAVGQGSGNLAQLGEQAWKATPKTSAEFFAMMYGSVVKQLTVDTPPTSPAAVSNINTQLEEMGFSIGLRLIDEYLAKAGGAAGVKQCQSFAQTASAISLVGFKMFLGVTAQAKDVTDSSYHVVFDDCPLTMFVELPETLRQSKLHYCNIVAGVIRGCLAQVEIHVTAQFEQDKLLGDPVFDILVTRK